MENAPALLSDEGPSMAETAPSPAPASRLQVWTPLGIIGLIAVIAGLLLPQLMPSEVPASPPREETRSPGDLRYTPPAWPEAPSQQGMFWRLGLGTMLVLGLCVGSLWYGKRWLNSLAARTTSAGELKLVETLHLGNRCCLHLVQLPARQILVGADASGIKTVVPLPDSFESVLAETAPEQPTAAETPA
jgi:flagellar biogenesis protein FliO